MENANTDLNLTDPEFSAIVRNLIENDVETRNVLLTTRQKELIKITALTTQQSYVMLKDEVSHALDVGLTPVEIKEAAMQCAPYSGLSRAADALSTINEVFTARDIKLPLEPQATINEETRFDKGLDAQATLFGDRMREIAKGERNAIPRVNYYLIVNCFGDYYTRTGLSLEDHEMLTLVVLMNLGIEPQMCSHMKGNLGIGNDQAFITEMIFECLPFMGYPRTLNALSYLNDVVAGTH